MNDKEKLKTTIIDYLLILALLYRYITDFTLSGIKNVSDLKSTILKH